MRYSDDMEIFGDAMMISSWKSAPDGLGGEGGAPTTGREAIDAVQRALDEHRLLMEKRRAQRLGQESEPREEQGSDGVTWMFRTVNDSFQRIVGCRGASGRLMVPAVIDRLPVLELAADACAHLADVTEIVCPTCIESIGPAAFRGCRELRRLVLPDAVDRFDSGWIAQCRKLVELTLPGMLPCMMPNVFDAEGLEVLVFGRATSAVNPGAFAKSSLRELRIPSENPFLASDGVSVFSSDGSCLVAVACPCETFEIPRGVTQVAPKAFASCAHLESAVLPDTLECIGAHAFEHCALRSLQTPSSLTCIGKRAFYRCRDLEEVTLASGLVEIGSEAFAATALKGLRIPASVTSFARDVVRDTSVLCFGRDATLRIEAGGELTLDVCGGLYRTGEGRPKTLVGLLNAQAETYAVETGTRVIGPCACMRLTALRTMRFPAGLLEIGEAAFRGCANLEEAPFPESLRSIGDEAFFDTSLRAVYLPASFERLGALALITKGAHEEQSAPSIRSVEVSLDCVRFYYTDGLLCERMDGGSSRIVLYDGSCESVVIPREVDTIGSYAFGNASNLHELSISTRVCHIEPKGLNVSCLIEHMHIDIEPPEEGHAELDLYFPDTERSIREIVMGFDRTTFISAEKLLARYDAAIVNMHDLDAMTARPLDVYGQATRIIERLQDPFYLSVNTRRMYEQMIRASLSDMCVAIARHDDRGALDALVVLGFIDQETILPVIERVGKLQDAAMTGYLLEVKRRLFRDSALDFAL